jgi:hypothetical protein
MVDALYGTIDDDSNQRAFDKHVVECEACAAVLAEMQGTLELMSKRERRDPGQAYWDGYYNRLTARMETEQAARGSARVTWWLRSFVGGASSRMSWAYRAAAVLAILTVGVFAGRTFFAPSSPFQEQPQVATEERGAGTLEQAPPAEEKGEVLASEPAPTRPKKSDAIDVPPGEKRSRSTQPSPSLPGGLATTEILPASSERAMCYIEKSQMLLVALVNSDPTAPDAYAGGFADRRQRSTALVAEASEITEELDDPKQRRLRELVSELQKILIQISNLESEEDADAVEFIRSSVNDHDVLLKINLEQMRHENEEDGCAPGAASGSNSQRSIY